MQAYKHGASKATKFDSHLAVSVVSDGLLVASVKTENLSKLGVIGRNNWDDT